MLKKLEKDELSRFIEYAWSLAGDRKTSSYPTFTDGIKTKADFVRDAEDSFEASDSEILLYIIAGKAAGWIHYRYDAGDDSVFVHSCLADGHYEEMIPEFIGFVRERYPTAMIGIGFPTENLSAVSAMAAGGFVLEEKSENYVLHVRDYRPRESECTRRITKAGFGAFRKLHDANGIEMYWNSKRILERFRLWNIYVYAAERKALGTIYAMDEGILTEIFGVDYLGNVFDRNAFHNLLAAFLNGAKADNVENVVYFCEKDEEKNDLAEMGFFDVGGYLYFVLR